MFTRLKTSIIVVFLCVLSTVAVADVTQQIGSAVIGVERNGVDTGISAVNQKEQAHIYAKQRRAEMESELADNDRRSQALRASLHKAEDDLEDLDAYQRRTHAYSEGEFNWKKTQAENQIAQLKNSIANLRDQYFRLEENMEKVSADEDAQVARINVQAKADTERRVVNEGAGVLNQILRDIFRK